MIEDSPVVNDIRQIRQAISKRFNHDLKKYLNYLQAVEQANQSVTLKTKEEKLPFPKIVEMKLEAPGQTQGCPPYKQQSRQPLPKPPN
jgi:hypothetical protein